MKGLRICDFRAQNSHNYIIKAHIMHMTQHWLAYQLRCKGYWMIENQQTTLPLMQGAGLTPLDFAIYLLRMGGHLGREEEALRSISYSSAAARNSDGNKLMMMPFI
jgi:hypothetical protein